MDEPVKAVSTRKDKWIPALAQLGFSEKAAKSISAMTEVTLEEKYEKLKSPIRCETILDQYIENLVAEKNNRQSQANF